MYVLILNSEYNININKKEMRNIKMTNNEIKKVNKNWKKFTGYNNPVEFWEENNSNSELLRKKIHEFIEKFNYEYEVYDYLYKDF